MPRGVYPRTANQLRAAAANLAKGREPAAREKATEKLREIARDPNWRDRVSEATTAAMHRPEVREKHLVGLAAQSGYNFKSGNGQALTLTVRGWEALLIPLGYCREYAIATAGHGTEHRPPTSYKADFAHPETKTVVELDGPSHRNRKQQVLDRKKDEVLIALGWTVTRVRHD